MSKLGWVNFDRDEQERVQNLIQALSEPGTVDDLGLGAIRDTIADHLFPGVSTIQTRLRYFVLVPRLIAGAARKFKGDPSEWMQKHELDLIATLQGNEEMEDSPKSSWDGLFGRTSGKSLKRRPSAVYWGGLKEWGILEEPLTIAEAVVATSQRAKAVPIEEGGAYFEDIWHPQLPHLWDYPDSKSETLTLSLQEADFLRGRVQASHPNSLLNWLFENATLSEEDWREPPWVILKDANLPGNLQADIDMAKRFSVLMHGAQLLYNLLLSKHFLGCEQEIDEYTAKLELWFERERHECPQLEDDGPLWPKIAEPRHTIRSSAVTFVKKWRKIGLTDPFGQEARDLVRKRQEEVKLSNAKLRKPPTDVWGGNSGAAQLIYRWPNVVRYVQDLNDAK